MGSLSMLTDITRRKEVEAKLKETLDNLEERVKEQVAELEKAYDSLKESENGLAEAQRMAHIGNWDWDLVTNNMYWSDEMYSIFGLIPRESDSSYDVILSRTHPDDREYVDNAVKKASKGEPFDIGHRIVLADGTERVVHAQGEVIFDKTNTPVRMIGTVQDITEQKRAEETLRESEARLRRFYESGMFGMLYYNLDGSITNANDKFLEIVGYTREDLQAGRINWAKMTPPEYRPLDEHAIVELKAIGVATPFEKEYIRKDGSSVPIILGVATFDQASNEGIAFVLDITERKKAEEALARSEKARKKEIHHRIKNNLQVISSLLDLQAEKFRDKEVLEAFKESKNRVFSMSLIHEELYKGEDTDTLDFSSYLQKLAKDLFQTYDLGGKNIRLCMNLEENAFFNMDIAIPLGIIVNELVSNSLKHAFIGRDSGEIQIKLSRGVKGEIKNEGSKSNNFILTVSDDGIGLPESFDVEYLDTLGFQLITTLIEQLDGELELKRDNGTTFIIRFTLTEMNNHASAPLL